MRSSRSEISSLWSLWIGLVITPSDVLISTALTSPSLQGVGRPLELILVANPDATPHPISGQQFQHRHPFGLPLKHFSRFPSVSLENSLCIPFANPSSISRLIVDHLLISCRAFFAPPRVVQAPSNEFSNCTCHHCVAPTTNVAIDRSSSSSSTDVHQNIFLQRNGPSWSRWSKHHAYLS